MAAEQVDKLVLHILCTSDVIAYIELDWITGNIYIFTICGELNISNRISLKCVTLEDFGGTGLILARIIPERGYSIILLNHYRWTCTLT